MLRGVEFEAGGARYQLRFGVNALCQIEHLTGEKFTQAAQRLQGEPSLTDLRMFWWAGLGEVTREQAGDLMDAVGLERAAQMIVEAITLAFPAADGADGKKPAGTAGRTVAKARR